MTPLTKPWKWHIDTVTINDSAKIRLRRPGGTVYSFFRSIDAACRAIETVERAKARRKRLGLH